MYLTDSKKVEDWQAIRADALNNHDELFWRKVYSDFFWGRINSRYLTPIESISNNGSYLGEGFSIVAIQCSLIEFLESTFKGEIYRLVNKPTELKKYEYSGSKKCFLSFLENRAPFNAIFDNKKANEFYSSIRCGILHEATTKNGWRIWGKSDSGKEIICFESKKIYRDDLQYALKDYMKSYADQLVADVELQKAFIRKFDALCE
ncbi:hypothetical protein [Pseudoalteromonas sp. S3431]|uniref:hypothetical protein n=1 Tax=Pseudoalteromonas sp. S3431 TaxID=579537 RepID=UPI0004A177AD|nr:hypothetical protein [Pseudoalteromonas sp. S3431]KDC49526.1 hypothetical protein DO88_18935 [Pseudoalteromonas sp. S3431]